MNKSEVEVKMNAEGYLIKDLEVLSGIKAHTIRIWEKRYGLLQPERTDTNIRFYSDDDLKKMLNVAMLVRNGFKISKVAAWNNEQVSETILSITETKSTESDYIDRLIISMLNFNNQEFNDLANEIIEKLGFEEAVSKVFFNLFTRIGTYWQIGSVFPAQEHNVTHIFRNKLIVEFEKLETTNSKNLVFLFYLPEDELHEMSLLYYSYLAKKYGYQVIYLGQSVPFNDIKKLSTQMKIDYVFTSFINSTLKEDLENYLTELKDLFQHQKVFITGGQIQFHEPKLPRNVKVVKNYHDFKKFLF